MNHCTDDELLEHLYGLKDGAPHLTACAECRTRLERLAAARHFATQPPDVPDEFLAAQRRSIYQRLHSPLRTWHPLRWTLSAAATLALVLGLTMYRSQPAQSHDDQFFSDMSSLAQTPTPRAVQPIESLVGDNLED